MRITDVIGALSALLWVACFGRHCHCHHAGGARHKSEEWAHNRYLAARSCFVRFAL